MIEPHLGSIKTTTNNCCIHSSFIHIEFGIWCLADLRLISHVANRSGPSLERSCEKKRFFMSSDVTRFKMPKKERSHVAADLLL